MKPLTTVSNSIISSILDTSEAYNNFSNMGKNNPKPDMPLLEVNTKN